MTKCCFDNRCKWSYKCLHIKMVHTDPLAVHRFWWLAKGSHWKKRKNQPERAETLAESLDEIISSLCWCILLMTDWFSRRLKYDSRFDLEFLWNIFLKIVVILLFKLHFLNWPKQTYSTFHWGILTWPNQDDRMNMTK